MKLLAIVLCGFSAALIMSLFAVPIRAWPEFAPFGAYTREIAAWGPALVLACVATFVLGQPRYFIGAGGRAIAVIGIAVAMLWPVVALAQEAAGAAADPGTTINLGDLFGDVRGTFVTVIGVGVAALFGWIAELVRRSTGLSIDTKMRDSLQSAVMNGVNYGLDAVQSRADATNIDVKSVIVAEGIQYVRSYAPKAAKHFGLSDADLGVMLRAKLTGLQSPEVKPAPQASGA